MKTHYESADVATMGAGAELRKLAALGMGWHWLEDVGNCENGFWVDANGIIASMRSDWWPDDGWSGAGRLLDEAKRLGWSPQVSHGAHDEEWFSWMRDAPGSRYALADTGPLAITRAWCAARVDVINKALGEGE